MTLAERRAVSRLTMLVDIFPSMRDEVVRELVSNIVNCFIAHEADALERAAQVVESFKNGTLLRSAPLDYDAKRPTVMDMRLDEVAAAIRALKEAT